MRTERHNPLEFLPLATRAKGIGGWCFGLTTALRWNGLTHEGRREETVVRRESYRIHGVPVGSRRVVIRKWNKALFGSGL